MAISSWMNKLKQKLYQQKQANSKIAHEIFDQRQRQIEEDLAQPDKRLGVAILTVLREMGKRPSFKKFENNLLKHYRQHNRQTAKYGNQHEPLSEKALKHYLELNRGHIESTVNRMHHLLLKDRARIKLRQVLEHSQNIDPPKTSQSQQPIINDKLQPIGQALERTLDKMNTSELEQVTAANNYKALKHIWNKMSELNHSLYNNMDEAEVLDVKNTLKKAAHQNRGFSDFKLRNMQRQGSQWAGMITFRVWNYLGAPDKYDYNPSRSTVLDQSTEELRQERRENKEAATEPENNPFEPPKPKP